jgi:hypothetical protein
MIEINRDIYALLETKKKGKKSQIPKLYPPL